MVKQTVKKWNHVTTDSRAYLGGQLEQRKRIKVSLKWDELVKLLRFSIANEEPHWKARTMEKLQLTGRSLF
jgi:hypothetical protein